MSSENGQSNTSVGRVVLRVLIACEVSGIVREAFRKRGHIAWSCDLLDTDQVGNHITGNVLDVLDEGWDLMIAHPPCTYLCSSGLHWNRRVPGRETKTKQALEVVRRLMDAPIERIAIENPVGRIGTAIRPADQYVQPWQFGHDASKKTGLWLKNLPKLEPTKIVEPRLVCCGKVLADGLGKYSCPNCCGDRVARPRHGNQTDSGQNNLAPSDDRWKKRSETYQGIADAMAIQWG